eukprot:scaffold12387_cov63-Cyclotella_meneghiniana.AAC.1
MSASQITAAVMDEDETKTKRKSEMGSVLRLCVSGLCVRQTSSRLKRPHRHKRGEKISRRRPPHTSCQYY